MYEQESSCLSGNQYVINLFFIIIIVFFITQKLLLLYFSSAQINHLYDSKILSTVFIIEKLQWHV